MKKSPYFIGALIGILSALTLAGARHTLGVSVAFVKMAALLLMPFAPSYVQHQPYYQTYLKGDPLIDWQLLLVIGIFAGAFFGARRSPSSQPIRSRLTSFIGGILVMWGARLAGGCTSGHVITGALQQSVSGWIFMIALFSTAVPVAYFLSRYPKKRL